MIPQYKDNIFYFYQGFPNSSVGKESTCNAGDPGSILGSGRSAGEGRGYPLQYSWALLVAQLVKNWHAMQETWVWSLGWEDPLEEGMATHSSILAWRISMDSEEPGRLYSPWGRKESDTTEWLSTVYLLGDSVAAAMWTRSNSKSTSLSNQNSFSLKKRHHLLAICSGMFIDISKFQFQSLPT